MPGLFQLRLIAALFLLTLSEGRLFGENASLAYLNRVLAGAEASLDKASATVSSGKLRLPDDPAGYAVYAELEKYVRGLDRLIANHEDMVSFYRLQGAILGTVLETMQRIRELVIQKDNGILSDSDREIIDNEIGQNYEQIEQTLRQAELNRVKLFGEALTNRLLLNGFSAQKYYQLDGVDRLIALFLRESSKAGAKENRSAYQIAGDRVAKENQIAAQDRLTPSFAEQVSNFKRGQLLMMVDMMLLKTKLESGR